MSLRIIIFEDDESLARLLEQVLLLKGHNVSCFPVPTVCPAYTDYEQECPKNRPCADIIFSDYMLPNMKGTQFFKLQRERGCHTLDANKVIVTGVNIDDVLKETIKKLGCHYIKKPFKIAEILKWVDECESRLR